MPALTLTEAANELRISVRRLSEIVKRHPYYYPNGNRKLFTHDNLASIRNALLEEKLNNEGRHNVTIHAGPSPSAALTRHWPCSRRERDELDQNGRSSDKNSGSAFPLSSTSLLV